MDFLKTISEKPGLMNAQRKKERERDECLTMSKSWCEEYTVIGLDKVILRASRVSSSAAAMSLRHGFHPQMVRFSYLDKMVTAQFIGPAY